MSVIDSAVEVVKFIVSFWKLIVLVGLVVLVWLALKRYRPDSFGFDRAIGLESDSFSLQDNIDGEDDRSGLEFWSKLRIRWLMFFHGISFDDAREMEVQNTFALNDVNPDGTPRDPKAFFFS